MTLGRYLERMRRLDEARKAYEEAIARYPKAGVTEQARERLKALTERIQKQAQRPGRRVPFVTPGETRVGHKALRCALSIGANLERNGSLDAARRTYERAIDQHPNAAGIEEVKKRLKAVKKQMEKKAE